MNYECGKCGAVIGRDHNSAITIDRAGQTRIYARGEGAVAHRRSGNATIAVLNRRHGVAEIERSQLATFFHLRQSPSPTSILVAKSLLKRLQGVALLNLKDLSGEKRIRRQYQLPDRTNIVKNFG
jgi:hypothetical protein